MLLMLLKSIDLCCELFLNRIIVEDVYIIDWIEFQTNLEIDLSFLRYALIEYIIILV